MNVKDQIKYFMEPKSIAMIGVPRRTGRLSLNFMENLLEYGYSGKVYPVNPGTDEIMGLKAYPSLDQIPGEIDMALIATPRAAVLDIVKECAAKGVKAVAILTQGFSDFNEEGKALEREMVRVIRKAGGRLLGPNSLGIANAFNHVHTSFARPEKTSLPIAVIAQTGSIFTGTQRFMPSGKGIDLGNTADIDFADCLEYFEDDTDIKVITLYIEGINDGRKFMEAARRVSKKKPILALKSGRSESGIKAARSHTGQMSNDDRVYEAVFRQCGVIRVADFEEQHDLARAFSCLPLMKGNGLAILTMSGMAGVLASDVCQDYGLQLSELQPETRDRIQAMSQPWVTISNPVDVWPVIFSKTNSDLSERYSEVSRMVLEMVAEDPAVDGILFIPAVFNSKDYLDPTEIIVQTANTFKEKPIVCFLHGRNTPLIAERLEETGKTAVFSSPQRAVRALGRLYQYYKITEDLA